MYPFLHFVMTYLAVSRQMLMSDASIWSSQQKLKLAKSINSQVISAHYSVESTRVDDFEALAYFIYTLNLQEDRQVIGAGGIYRHVENAPAIAEILTALSNNPPASVSFLRSQKRAIPYFSRSSLRSP
jgi:hypothetical protein